MKKSYKIINNKSTMQGGKTGTSGNVGVLVDDLLAFATSIIDTIIDTTELIVDVVELPYDIGKAYEDPAGKLLEH